MKGINRESSKAMSKFGLWYRTVARPPLIRVRKVQIVVEIVKIQTFLSRRVRQSLNLHAAKSKLGSRSDQEFVAKGSDTVKRQALFPHAALQYEYSSQSVQFVNLSFSQFVAGEIEIITGGKLRERRR
jgi:hypothetical protein